MEQRHTRQATPSRYTRIHCAMSTHHAKAFGQKYSCPGCQALLKFRRPPTRSLQSCPNCRRTIRLHEKAAAGNRDADIKRAIEELADWDVPETPRYSYSRDPLLDQIDDSQPHVWTFNQPWPENTGEVVADRVEVIVNTEDLESIAQFRFGLLDGIHRRVTVQRTGEVEEIAVDGHWWADENGEPLEHRLGILSRSVVRELNRIPHARRFASRINCLVLGTIEGHEVPKLFVDLAIDESPEPSAREQKRLR